jgi:hypothetical protein
MGNITQQIKSALRKAFPATKFKVTRNGGNIEWTDDGPSVEQVRDELLNTKCITEDERKYFDGSRHFYANYDGDRHQNHIYFNRYNAAQREAGKAQAAQWREEYEDRRKRQDAAVSEASGIVHGIRGVYDRTGSIEETVRVCFQTPVALVRSVIADYQQTTHHQLGQESKAVSC